MTLTGAVGNAKIRAIWDVQCIIFAKTSWQAGDISAKVYGSGIEDTGLGANKWLELARISEGNANRVVGKLIDECCRTPVAKFFAVGQVAREIIESGSEIQHPLPTVMVERAHGPQINSTRDPAFDLAGRRRLIDARA